MTLLPPVPLRGRGLLLVAACLVGLWLPQHSALAQENPQAVPDLATLEAQYEEAFRAALEMSAAEPLDQLQAWGAVTMSAVVLERVRAIASAEAQGSPVPSIDTEAIVDGVLERWRRLRPEDSGPDLFRAIQIQDPEAKRLAVVELLDHYPDDVLVLWQAAALLRQAGESQRATVVLEAFGARHPDRSIAYKLLAQHYGSLENETRRAEVLGRWAQAFPQDPELVSLWMTSALPRQEPEATARLLEGFLAAEPRGRNALQACREMLRYKGSSYEESGRGCMARLAADPDPSSEVAEAATSELVAMAAADGDWSRLLEILKRLGPEARVRAAIAAARQLEAPDRCGERLDLLRSASTALPADGSLHRSLTSALKPCEARPAAQALYLDLLRSVSTSKVPDLLYGWVARVNGVWRGDLPSGIVAVLEDRLREEPDALALYKALDLAYQLEDASEKRFGLLQRWQERFPASFEAELAEALAWGLVERDDLGGAIRALEQQVEHRFEPPVAVLLWELYLDQGGPEPAERFAADLVASGSPVRRAAGHHLAARSAVLAKDFGAAERHYWEALSVPDKVARPNVAAELLAMVASRGGTDRLPALARRICEETPLGQSGSDASGCAAELLTKAGSGEVATALLIERNTELPEDVKSLRALAQTAESAGRMGVAEQAWRRVVEIDPRDETHWVRLGSFLEKQGEVGELEELLVEARSALPAPPSDLLRAVGRARITAGQPERALQVLQEARAALPAGANPAWIDIEVRQAYAALGRAVPATATSSQRVTPEQPSPRPASLELSEKTPVELLAAAEALQSGSGGRYDPKAAEELFEQAAQRGDPLASYRLALLRKLKNPQTPRDLDEAEDLYRRSVSDVEARAEKGDPYAEYLVGTAALIGLGGREDQPRARRWLELAARQGVGWAWHNLAWMNETGRALEAPDPAAALEAYRKGSERGNVVSMVGFARLVLIPYGSKPLCDEGLRWLERSAQRGHPIAAAFLGKILYHGRADCVTVAPETALKWLKAAETAGERDADFDLALALLIGDAGEKDATRAIALFERLAERPSALGLETLAFLYATGVGVVRDPEKARELMADAAEIGSDGLLNFQRQAEISTPFQRLVRTGAERLEVRAAKADPAAAAFLAYLLYRGSGVPADPERAVHLAQIGATAGDADAMRTLAQALRNGIGIEQDLEEGRRWLSRGADSGNSFCMLFYSYVLMQGEEVQRDLETGLRWLIRSAEAGNWWAISDLGNLYDEGWYGLPRDARKAARWKQVLAARGDTESRGWLITHGYPVE